MWEEGASCNFDMEGRDTAGYVATICLLDTPTGRFVVFMCVGRGHRAILAWQDMTGLDG